MVACLERRVTGDLFRPLRNLRDGKRRIVHSRQTSRRPGLFQARAGGLRR